MKKILIILFLVFIIGCESNSENSLHTTTLTKEYPGNISNVNKVELLDGSSGERKIVNNNKIIQEWLSQIKDVELIPEKNQGPRTGFLFGVTLFEGNSEKLWFISHKINDVYYKANEKFVDPIRTFFEEQFGRGF